MALTKDELLRPRYKVIESYPGSNFEVGDILTLNLINEDERINKDVYYCYHGAYGPLTEYDLSPYPHLFRKLEWWEERPEGELPQYLKSISVALSMKIGEVCKVRKYAADIKKAGVFLEGKSFSRLIETMVPSDEEEYNQYIKQQSNQ